MSYILDALRKSESERRQGKVPELGHQVQLIHKPRKTPRSALVWVGLALALNAAVLAFVFWPEIQRDKPASERSISSQAATSEPPVVQESPEKEAPAKPAEPEEAEATVTSTAPTESVEKSKVSAPLQSDSKPTEKPTQALAEAPSKEKPTIIVPSARQSNSYAESAPSSDPGSVRHLVEMPLAYQKSIPDLVFNSHIYASDPASRRVMINGHYLRTGETFSGIRVERITEEGVVLSKDGQSFRVGSVRNWVSPD